MRKHAKRMGLLVASLAFIATVTIAKEPDGSPIEEKPKTKILPDDLVIQTPMSVKRVILLIPRENQPPKQVVINLNRD